MENTERRQTATRSIPETLTFRELRSARELLAQRKMKSYRGPWWLLPAMIVIALLLIWPASLEAGDGDADGIADEVDNCPDLFNPLQNVPPTRLSDPLTPGGNVSELGICADGTRVVYLADQETDETYELYVVPIGGGPVMKLSDPLTLNGDVEKFQLSRDCLRVVYLADQEMNAVTELYSVSILGGEVENLNGALTPGGDVTAYAISPDGSTVVYHADQDADETFEIYSVPIGGGTSTKLNGELVAGGDASLGGPYPSYRITPDGTTVVYVADQETDQLFELYSVPIDGSSQPTKLIAPGSVILSNGLFRISPDNAWVVFQALSDFEGPGLYSVPINGGTVPVRLNAPGRGAFPGLISSDSQWVVYRENMWPFELFSVPITGGTQVNLAPLGPGGSIPSSFDVWLSADSNWVVYRADQEANDVFELFSVPIAGGAPAKLNGLLTGGGDVEYLGVYDPISPDSSRVVYLADQETDGVLELFSVPIEGGEVTKLNGSLDPGELVTARASIISPDSNWVVYRRHGTETIPGLYRAPLEGGASIPINGPIPDGGNVGGQQISPDSAHVVYVARQEPTSSTELYSAPLVQDTDGDVILDPCDCAPEDPTTHPGAAEVNDGFDNQCSGESGFGLVDEIEGGFFESRTVFSWISQPQATQYEIVRAGAPDFATVEGCVAWAETQAEATIPEVPGAGDVHFFLVRAASPNAGSWGAGPFGMERTVNCLAP